jgi:hypothetical protein
VSLSLQKAKGEVLDPFVHRESFYQKVEVIGVSIESLETLLELKLDYQAIRLLMTDCLKSALQEKSGYWALPAVPLQESDRLSQRPLFRPH